MVKIKFCILFIALLLITSCPNTMWTGMEYSGEIDDDDSHFLTRYYDTYGIYYSGTWEIEFTSHDDVILYLEVKDNWNMDKYFDNLSSVSGDTVAKTVWLSSSSLLTVYTYSTNSDWVNNGNKAEYTIKATLL